MPRSFQLCIAAPALLLVACRAPVRQSAGEQAPQVVATAAPVVAPVASATKRPPPGHWSTQSRNPSTADILDRRRGATMFATSVASDEGSEGELYVERSAEGVVGLWGDTVVTGVVGASSTLTLRDAGTDHVVFEGVWSPSGVDGTIHAEGTSRRVRSLPPTDLATLREKLSVSEARRTLTIELAQGRVTRASTMLYQPPSPRETATPVRIDGPSLVIADERGEWRLTATARALVGRSPTGKVVRASFSEVPDGVALPFRRGDIVLSVQRLKKGAKNTACEIDVAQPSLRGTSADRSIELALRQEAIEAAAGQWPSGEPAPTLATFTCARDPMIPLKIQVADFVATALPAGFVGLRLSGYARFSDVGGVSTTNKCLLVDTARGVLIADVLSALPEAAREAVRVHADRAFKRELRTSKLTLDDFYTEDSLARLDGTSGCVTPTGLRLLVPLGLITKQMPTAPLVADVPAAVIAARLPLDHALRPLFVEAGPPEPRR